ncbi:MAG: hypothetical protein Kow00111_12580 [Thermincola ferriacetica]
MPVEKAINILEGIKGTQLNQELLVEIFIKIIQGRTDPPKRQVTGLPPES